MALLRTELASRLDDIDGEREAAAANNSMRPAREVVRHLADLDKEAAELRRRLAKSIDKDDESRAIENAQGGDYWFKRFLTTLGIANAGAFAALASGVLQADKPADIAPLVASAMEWFTYGMLAAGAIPFFLWVRYRADKVLNEVFENVDDPEKLKQRLESITLFVTIIMAFVSIMAFAAGLFTALGSLRGLAAH